MSDHNERPCQKCGSLTHHENDCNDELDRLRQENERLKSEVEELKAKLKDAYLPSSAHIQDIYELTSHKQALEVARVALSDAQTKLIEHHEYRVMRDEHSVCPVCTSKEGDVALNNISRSLTTINNVLKEGK